MFHFFPPLWCELQVVKFLLSVVANVIPAPRDFEASLGPRLAWATELRPSFKKKGWGWGGDGSVGKVLAMKVSGLGFGSLAHMYVLSSR